MGLRFNKQKFNVLKRTIKKEFESVKDEAGLEKFRVKYLGRGGEFNKILSQLPKLSEKQKKFVGESINILKKETEKLIKGKFQYFKDLKLKEEFRKEKIDITAPFKKPFVGHLHPLTLIQRKIFKIFEGIGFEIILGPEVENEYNNFDALNIPKNHPARDLWDTFWLKDKTLFISKDKKDQFNKNLLLRTHTSPVQIRYMKKHNPPFRIISPGRCFRYEATDSTHNFQFYQLEGLMVDKNITMANLKAIIREFLNKFFKKEIKIRFRPSYFPFVEPGIEVDIACFKCQGKGCSVCSYEGWFEVMGAGMVHQNVFKAVGFAPRRWQGFAFGMGIERLAMIKYKIDDIRLFTGGDLRFINQF